MTATPLLIVGNPSLPPESSAVAQIDSTTQGALPWPRQTTAQRTAITGVNALTIYDTDLQALFIWQSGAWLQVSGGGISGSFLNVALTGTAGSGYLQALAQASDPSAPAATGFRLFPNASGYLAWRLKNGSDTFVRNLAGVLTADRTYTLPDANAALFGTAAIAALTISSGAITVDARSFFSIAPESGSSDDLDTLSGTAAGKIVVIRPTSTNVIRVTTAGNVVTLDGAAITLSGSTQSLTLIYDDGQSKWIVIGRQTLGAAGVTSRIVQVFFADTASVIGAGKTGLVYNTAGLTCYYKRTSANAAVAVTLATMTLGTWATGGFKEVDATHMPGVYELGVPDAALAVGDGSTSVSIEFVISAPASAVARPIVIPLS